MRARDAEHVVAERLDQTFEIHRDERLVLDDHHVGRDLGGEFAAGFIDQLAQGGDVAFQHFGGILSEKPSSATSRKACRGLGVRLLRRCSAGRFLPPAPPDPFTTTEFQIFVNRR